MSNHFFLSNFRTVWPCIAINSLWIKPTDAMNSKFIGITTLHVSGSLSAHHEFLTVHRHWYILCSFDDRLLPVWWPFATRSRMELANQFHPAPGYKSGIQWVCWFYSQGVIICFVHLQTTGWTKIIFLESETQQSHAPTCNLHFVDFIGLCEQSFVFFNYADTRILKRHASV